MDQQTLLWVLGGMNAVTWLLLGWIKIDIKNLWKRADCHGHTITCDNNGWIGVDLDGTLARYDGWVGPEFIGEPIPEMLKRVKHWIANGHTVKIFTARCSIPEQIPPIKNWLKKYGIGGLEITNIKDFAMIELWDDRCVRVVTNSGQPCCMDYTQK